MNKQTWKNTKEKYQGDNISCKPSTKQRFDEISKRINGRNNINYTNDEIFRLLIDVWWYYENG